MHLFPNNKDEEYFLIIRLDTLFPTGLNKSLSHPQAQLIPFGQAISVPLNLVSAFFISPFLKFLLSLD